MYQLYSSESDCAYEINALTIYGDAGRAVMKPLHFNGEISATRISVTKSMPVLPIVYSSSPIVGFSTGQQNHVGGSSVELTSGERIDILGGSDDDETKDIE